MFNEQAIISKILCNLPGGFDTLIPAWRMQAEASKTLDNLTLQLLQTESMLKSRVDEITTSATYVATSSSKSSPYTPEQRAARQKEISDRKKTTKCWKCGITGHWGRECIASEADQQKYQESKNQPQSSNNQFKQQSGGHKAFMASINEVSSNSSSWFVDSGCTEHMTDNRSYFSTNQDVSLEHRPVQGIGGALLMVAGVGDINIKIQHGHEYTFGILKGVNHVPSLGRNLFSSYVAAQKKIFTLHTDTGCQLIEEGQIVMTGSIYNRMYKLNIEVVHHDSPCTALAATSATSFGIPTAVDSHLTLDIWHRRLAHLNYATIQQMASQGIVDGLVLSDRHKSFCSGCAYGKHARAPFPFDNHHERSKNPGDLIHSDLCGLMSVPSVGGALYFILFKDNCSGF